MILAAPIRCLAHACESMVGSRVVPEVQPRLLESDHERPADDVLATAAEALGGPCRPEAFRGSQVEWPEASTWPEAITWPETVIWTEAVRWPQAKW
jgi:hypothetical protein